MSREVITTSPFFAEREQEFRRILGIELDAETLAVLRQLQYTPRLRQGIMDALAAVMQRGVVSNHDLFVGHRERGIVFRDVRTGQELVIPDTSMILELGEAAAALTATVLAANSPYPLELQQVIANIARRLLQPNLTFNKEETEARKKQALEAVKPVFFQVKRGEMIIREGERVREEHIPRLRALASGKRQRRPGFCGGRHDDLRRGRGHFWVALLTSIAVARVVGFAIAAAVGGPAGGQYPGRAGVHGRRPSAWWKVSRSWRAGSSCTPCR